MDSSKYTSLNEVFNFTWHEVVCGFWRRYPNDYSKHVLSEDVLEREVREDGTLRTLRVISKRNPLPRWGGLVFSRNLKKVCIVLEESIVDPITHTMTAYTWNLSYRNMMDVQEKMTIERGANNTNFFREGWVDSSLTGFRRLLRQFGINRWKSNAKKSFNGYLHILNGASETGKLSKVAEQTIETIEKAKKNAQNVAAAVDSAYIKVANVNKVPR
jgi:hypothetical protein